MRCTGFFIRIVNSPKCSAGNAALLLYHIVMEIATWANVIRFFFAYSTNEGFSEELMIKIYLHILYFFVALTYSLSCLANPKAARVLAAFDDYHERYECEFNAKKVKKQILVAGLLFAEICLFFVLYRLFC